MEKAYYEIIEDDSHFRESDKYLRSEEARSDCKEGKIF